MARNHASGSFNSIDLWVEVYDERLGLLYGVDCRAEGPVQWEGKIWRDSAGTGLPGDDFLTADVSVVNLGEVEAAIRGRLPGLLPVWSKQELGEVLDYEATMAVLKTA